jgi:hypothetical protein
MLVALGATVGCDQGGKSQETKPIDAGTVTAYEKLGGENGGWAKKGYPNFLTAKQIAGEVEGKKHEIGLWGFHFKEFPESKLPEVAVPFGLDFMHTPVTDQDLKGLAHLKSLTRLTLLGSKVTDAGLKELAPLANLSKLDLDSTKVTDAGLKELTPLKNLSALRLVDTGVTDAGVAELRKSLPNCEIKHGPIPPPTGGDKK